MKRLALSFVMVASIATGAAFGQTAGGAAAPAAAFAQSEIPPNCTLDPWTGKMTCHIWPTCTLDPWTGKMNCPVPRLATRMF